MSPPFRSGQQAEAIRITVATRQASAGDPAGSGRGRDGFRGAGRRLASGAYGIQRGQRMLKLCPVVSVSGNGPATWVADPVARSYGKMCTASVQGEVTGDHRANDIQPASTGVILCAAD